MRFPLTGTFLAHRFFCPRGLLTWRLEPGFFSGICGKLPERFPAFHSSNFDRSADALQVLFSYSFRFAHRPSQGLFSERRGSWGPSPCGLCGGLPHPVAPPVLISALPAAEPVLLNPTPFFRRRVWRRAYPSVFRRDRDYPGGCGVSAFEAARYCPTYR